MAKQGQKLNPELREKIKARLAENDNIRETAREFGVSPATVKGIKDESPDEFEQLRTDKREELIDIIYDDMKDALTLGRQKIKMAQVAMEEFQPTVDKLIDLLSEKDDVKGGDIIEVIKAISSITNIPLGQISTYFGTIYDKRALMKGDSTANTNTTVRLEGDLDRWAN